MQTDYLYHGIKGYAKLKKFSYILEMTTKEATQRYKIIEFLIKSHFLLSHLLIVHYKENGTYFFSLVIRLSNIYLNNPIDTFIVFLYGFDAMYSFLILLQFLLQEHHQSF